MSIKERVAEKENIVRELFASIRSGLNSKSKNFSTNPNDWSYITSLSFAEQKLKELNQYLLDEL